MRRRGRAATQPAAAQRAQHSATEAVSSPLQSCGPHLGRAHCPPSSAASGIVGCWFLHMDLLAPPNDATSCTPCAFACCRTRTAPSGSRQWRPAPQQVACEHAGPQYQTAQHSPQRMLTVPFFLASLNPHIAACRAGVAPWPRRLSTVGPAQSHNTSRIGQSVAGITGAPLPGGSLTPAARPVGEWLTACGHVGPRTVRPASLACAHASSHCC